jgi:hypothetical protein
MGFVFTSSSGIGSKEEFEEINRAYDHAYREYIEILTRQNPLAIYKECRSPATFKPITYPLMTYSNSKKGKYN